MVSAPWENVWKRGFHVKYLETSIFDQHMNSALVHMRAKHLHDCFKLFSYGLQLKLEAELLTNFYQKCDSYQKFPLTSLQFKKKIIP